MLDVSSYKAEPKPKPEPTLVWARDGHPSYKAETEPEPEPTLVRAWDCIYLRTGSFVYRTEKVITINIS